MEGYRCRPTGKFSEIIIIDTDRLRQIITYSTSRVSVFNLLLTEWFHHCIGYIKRYPLVHVTNLFPVTQWCFLVLPQTTERKLLLYWPPCSPTLPNKLLELGNGALLFVYLVHSSVSIRYDQSILSTIGQNGQAFVDTRHSREREEVCALNIQHVLCK